MIATLCPADLAAKICSEPLVCRHVVQLWAVSLMTDYIKPTHAVEYTDQETICTGSHTSVHSKAVADCSECSISGI